MKNYSLFVAFSFLILSAHSAFAAKVTQVKGNKMMIDLEGESASAGSEFFAINPQGKKVAIVRVTQSKGGRAIGEITKGSAKVGYSLQSKGGGSSASGGGGDYYDRKLNNRVNNGNSWGITGGYLMNSMKVATSRINASLSGSGFGFLGYYDYAFSPSVTLRAAGGLEMYNVAGSNTAASPSNCTGDCNVKINYLSMYGLARWNITQGNYKTWLGAGIGYLYPMSSSSTIFEKSQLGANQIFSFALGTDIRMSSKSYIPVSLEYGMFPTTSTVTANIIYLRVGYAWYL